MDSDFSIKIKEFASSAKGARKKIAMLMLHRPDDASFMTIEELAANVGISAGMVSRVVRDMGYVGFADMQAHLRQSVRKNFSPTARLQEARDTHAGAQDSLRQDMENLSSIARLNSDEILSKAAGFLVQAPAVHVMGLRTSHAVAHFLVSALGQLRRNVTLLGSDSGGIVEQIKSFDPGDVVVLVSFPRYLVETLRMAEEAKVAGCTLLGITDSTASPLALESDVALLAPYEGTSFFNSLVAPLGIVNLLLAYVADMLQDKGVAELERMNSIRERWNQLIDKKHAWEGIVKTPSSRWPQKDRTSTSG